MVKTCFVKTLHNLKRISGLLNVPWHSSRARCWWFITLSNRYCHTINWVPINYSLRPYINKHLSSLEEVSFFNVDVNCFPYSLRDVLQINQGEFLVLRHHVKEAICLSIVLKAGKPAAFTACIRESNSNNWKRSRFYFIYKNMVFLTSDYLTWLFHSENWF